MISTIFQILVTLLIVGAFVFIYKFLFNKRKLNKKNKSSVEKLIITLQTKFAKCVKDLNRNLRTPEDIQDEMLEALYEYKNTKINEIKNVVARLTETEISINDNICSLYNAKMRIKSKIEDLKKSESPNVMLGASLMKQLDSVEKSLEKATVSKSDIEKQILDINTMVANFNTKIEIKRTEVLTMITNYIASSCSTPLRIDIDLSDLMGDYTTEITIKERQNKIDEIVMDKANDIEIVPDDYIKKFNEYKG